MTKRILVGTALAVDDPVRIPSSLLWAACFIPFAGATCGCGGNIGGGSADSGANPGTDASAAIDSGSPDASIGVEVRTNPDRSVLAGLVVKLDGSATSGATAFGWAQTSGASLEIVDETQAVAWVAIPPGTAAGTSYQFTLTGGNGESTDSALVAITVKDPQFEDFTPSINDTSILNTSEGLAFNAEGMWVVSQQDILSLFDPQGAYVRGYTIPGLPVGANFDINGKLVIAINSNGTAIAVDTSDGSSALIDNGMGTANYPLTDRDGNLFVSNRQGGAVYRYSATTQNATVFVDGGDGIGSNPNSVAFGPEDDVLYVGTACQVYRVPILANGSAGTPALYLTVPSCSGLDIDGLSFDEGRNMYVGVPGTAGLYIAPYRETGTTTVARQFLNVDGAASTHSIFTNITHGTAAFGDTTMYYTNLNSTHVGRIDVGLPRLDPPLAVPR